MLIVPVYDPTAIHNINGILNTGAVTEFTIPSGAGTRLMWLPSKRAFRAGMVDGTQWDEANIGDYSFAFGKNVKALKSYSIAIGENSEVPAGDFGTAGIAWGYYCTADGNWSKALGYGIATHGNDSQAFGASITTWGRGSLAIGYNRNYDATSFVAGDGIRNYGYGQIAMGSASWGKTLKAEGECSVAIGLDVNALDPKTLGQILTISINTAGTGYTVGNTLTVSGGNDDATINVDSVDGAGAITAVSILYTNCNGTGYAAASAINVTGGSGSGAKVNILTVGAVCVIAFGRRFSASLSDSFNIGFGQLDYQFTATQANFKDSIILAPSGLYGSSGEGILFTTSALYFLAGSKELCRMYGGKNAYVEFNQTKTADIDFRISSNSITSLFKVDSGLNVVRIGDGGTTNYAEFSATGELTLFGSAALEVADHGSAEIDKVVNVCYGTGDPPAANTTTIGTLFVKYAA